MKKPCTTGNPQLRSQRLSLASENKKIDRENEILKQTLRKNALVNLSKHGCSGYNSHKSCTDSLT